MKVLKTQPPLYMAERLCQNPFMPSLWISPGTGQNYELTSYMGVGGGMMGGPRWVWAGVGLRPLCLEPEQ